jgi:hypothetical protein
VCSRWLGKNQLEVEVKVEVIYDRQSVGHPSGTSYQFFFLLEIFFKTFTGLLFCSALSDEKTGL